MTAEDIDFQRMIGALKRQWKLIAAVTLGLGMASAAGVLMLPNWYMAEAVLLVDPQASKIGAVDVAAGQNPLDPGKVRSEVELATDGGVVADVIKKLDLTTDPEFRAFTVPPARSPWASYFSSLGLAAIQAEETADPVQKLSKMLLKHAGVHNDGRSYIIRLSFEWTDPEKAVRIANTWSDVYLQRQLAVKFEMATKTEAWLRERTAELQKTAAESERAVQEYRDAHQLLEVKGATIGQQQLNELNTQLVLAGADRAQKEAIVAQARQNSLESTSPVLNSALIQRLREQEADISRRLSELRVNFGEEHPAVKRARGERDDVERKIHGEIAKVAMSAETDAASARGREAEIKRQLDKIRVGAIESDGAQVRLKQLEREAQANRALLAQFMLQLKEATAREGLERPEVRLVSAAVRPEGPSFPNRALLIALGFLGSASIGTVAGFGRERFSLRFADPASLRLATEMPLLGMIPEVRLRRGMRLADYVLCWPRSELGEAVRTIRTRLYVALAAGLQSETALRGRVVLITSSVSDEGKTTLAVALARSAARGGKRVLLVDADLRRAAVGRALGGDLEADDSVEIGNGGAGLDLVKSQEGEWRGEERFHGEGEGFDALVSVDRVSGLHYAVPACPGEDPQEVLGSCAMRDFIERARSIYELVIIDSPPVLVVSDAVVLSGLADGILYVMRWERTPRAAVMGAVRVLRDAGGVFVGMVMSRVDTKRMLGEWVAETGSLSGRYHDYSRDPSALEPRPARLLGQGKA